MAATMQDVARLAGVSAKTVSNVVNEHPHVSPETRAKVQKAIDKLGYELNFTARSLRKGRTGLIGLALRDGGASPWSGRTRARGCAPEPPLAQTGRPQRRRGRRTFGSFVEHLGRCVYTGIHEPAHPGADAEGFRTDVLELVKELGISTVRYPGGNFVSGYRWEDGVGPLDQRPHRLDLAWHSSDPNTVGTDEFMRWAATADVEPVMAVNLGTRGVQEALDILEYCNVPGVSHFAEKRRTNGADDPYRVKMWCLGNEMDGPWQVGHKTAAEYGRLAAETARAMRMIDPGLELVVCGSSSRAILTFGDWERTVLTEAWDHVDMISAHAYYWEQESGLQEFLVSAEDIDRFIDQVAATADAVGAARKSDKRIGISFDEWNVWYQDRTSSMPPTGDDWPVAPRLLEDNYTVADAVVVGNLLTSLLRHTDRVWSASLAQLVNVIAPIESEAFGPVKAIDAVATWDESGGAIFLVNRSADASHAVTIEIPAGASLEGTTLGLVLLGAARGPSPNRSQQRLPPHRHPTPSFVTLSLGLGQDLPRGGIMRSVSSPIRMTR